MIESMAAEAAGGGAFDERLQPMAVRCG